MRTQTKILSTKININFFFSDAPNFALTPKVKKSFLSLSLWDDELLSTPNTITFLARSLPKLHSPFFHLMLFHNRFTHIFLYHYFLLY